MHQLLLPAVEAGGVLVLEPAQRTLENKNMPIRRCGENLPVSRVLGAVQDPLLLLLASCLDGDREGAGHGDDIGIDLVAWHGALGSDIEGPSQCAEERK